jgi:cytochrome P450
MATVAGDTRSSLDPHAIVFPAAEHAGCPFPAYAALRDGDPVHKVPGRNEYLVSRYEDMVYVLRHPELFSNVTYAFEHGARRPATLADLAARGPKSVAAFQACDPPAHTWKRKLASAHFRPGQVRAYEPIVRATVDELIDRFVDRGKVEFISEFARPLGAVTTMLIVGLPVEDAPRAEPWSSYDGQGTPYHDQQRQDEIAVQVRHMQGYIREAIESRHREPRDDILTQFVQAHIEASGEKLGLEHAVLDTFSIMMGGVGTSSHMLGNTMLLFLRNSAQDKLRDSAKLRESAIEEALRLESPVQWNLRLVTQDLELGGTAIEAGSFVLMLFGSGNHDDRQFPASDEFDAERRNVRQHLAFGHGRHFCLGAPLVRLQAQIACERLLARLADIELDGGEAAYKHVFSLAFRGLEHLDLTFRPV